MVIGYTVVTTSIQKSGDHSTSETRAILWATALSFLSCFFFALTCAWLHLHTFAATLLLGWRGLARRSVGRDRNQHNLPKLSPMIAASHAVGWLAKLAIAACAFVLIVG